MMFIALGIVGIFSSLYMHNWVAAIWAFNFTVMSYSVYTYETLPRNK